LQAQQRRILQLEGEVEALRVESGRQQEALVQQRAQTRAAEARIQELQQELDNNAGTAAMVDFLLCMYASCSGACRAYIVLCIHVRDAALLHLREFAAASLSWHLSSA
jgi:TolA-binding protein